MLSVMEQIAPFIDRLIEERGISAERKPELVKGLRRVFSKALAEALPNDKLDEFSQLIEDRNFSFDDADRFYLSNGIDMQKIFSVVAGDFAKNLKEEA